MIRKREEDLHPPAHGRFDSRVGIRCRVVAASSASLGGRGPVVRASSRGAESGMWIQTRLKGQPMGRPCGLVSVAGHARYRMQDSWDPCDV